MQCCAFTLKTCTLRIVINKERCSDLKDGKIWDYLLAMFVGYLGIDKKFVSNSFIAIHGLSQKNETTGRETVPPSYASHKFDPD
jgi:hypothetical protein